MTDYEFLKLVQKGIDIGFGMTDNEGTKARTEMKQRQVMKALDKAGIQKRVKSSTNHIIYFLPTGYVLSLNGGKSEATAEMLSKIRKAGVKI